MKVLDRALNTTEKEIEFLDGIVCNRHCKPHRARSEMHALLMNYIASIHKRRWDAGIDIKLVEHHAKSILILLAHGS